MRARVLEAIVRSMIEEARLGEERNVGNPSFIITEGFADPGDAIALRVHSRIVPIEVMSVEITQENDVFV